MKVYIVLYCYYDHTEIAAVFKREEDADEYVKKQERRVGDYVVHAEIAL